MTDWGVAVAAEGRAQLEILLPPVLRALGCDEGAHEPLGGATTFGGDASFRVGGRAGRPPRPLVASDAGAAVLFDGRLDNRAALAASLDLEGFEPTDAGILLALWRRSGEAAFASLQGPFAAAIWDAVARRLLLARDVLGDRGLSYSWSRRRQAPLVVAPDASALLSIPGVSADWNERSVARLFAVHPPAQGETYFSAIAEVPRGHVVAWTAEGGIEVRRFARLEPDWSARNERDRVGRLRELLTDAVRHSLAGPGETGILLSGGLDSAAIASRAAALTPIAERPHALTWVFEELPAGEPVEGIAALVGALELPWHPIVADGLWPLGGDDWTVDASFPSSDLYLRPLNASLRLASQLGLRVLLNGQYGDQLWAEGGMWLRALLRRGRLDLAAGRLARQWRLEQTGGPRRGSARGALRRLLPGANRPSVPMPPAWLTSDAWAAAGIEAGADPIPAGVNGAQWSSVDDAFAPLGIHWNRMLAARWGIDIAFPYRHRALIEWMLAVPADRLYSPGANKLLLRQMLSSEVPRPTAERWRPGSLAPLAVRGLVERERSRIEATLRQPGAAWPRFVRRDWVLDRLSDRLNGGTGPSSLVAWFCVCLELWRRELGERALAA
jgi:asparagine synthase (glutamine-hydrolysing)